MLTGHIYFAWVWIVLGLAAGVAQGLGFHREEFLGGYGSWRRRLTRLGHISFFGTAFLNLAMALSAAPLGVDPAGLIASSLLVFTGSITMPLICYLAAWRKPLRHLFFVPALSLTGGAGLFALSALRQAF